MYRVAAHVPKPSNGFDYRIFYFNKFESALDYMKDLLHNNLADSVEIESIHTED